jgi:hypothetical protein
MALGNFFFFLIVVLGFKNSGFCACRAGALPFEPFCQTFLLFIYFSGGILSLRTEWGSCWSGPKRSYLWPGHRWDNRRALPRPVCLICNSELSIEPFFGCFLELTVEGGGGGLLNMWHLKVTRENIFVRIGRSNVTSFTLMIVQPFVCHRSYPSPVLQRGDILFQN